MKTKTFQIHPELIKESILDLLLKREKITKKTVSDNINTRIHFIITSGNVDLTIFSQSNIDDWKDCGGDYNDVIQHYNRIK
jgi:hypothetical protein